MQDEIFTLVDNPPHEFNHVNLETIEAIKLNLLGSNAHQMTQNTQSLYLLDIPSGGVDERAVELLEQARIGRAYPEEIIEIMQRTHLRSAELARLTHPYNLRGESLGNMMTHVSLALEEAGATMTPEGLSRGRYKFFDHQRATDYGIFTIKNDIAKMDDITYTERRTFAFQTDHDDFPVRVRKEMSNARSLTDKIASPAHYAQWRDLLFRQSGFEGHVAEVFQRDTPLPPYMIPVSTVVYAHRPA
jgi:hypothetical protein